MAGRPEKTRRVAVEPEYLCFTPGGLAGGSDLTLGVDELEALRLVDLLGMSQAQAAASMGVGRATVSAICDRAHAKVADALVNGRRLVIAGGSVAYGPAERTGAAPWPPKGSGAMRIAVTFDGGNVFQHFGRTEQFKVYDVEKGKVVSSEVVGSGGVGHGALAGVLASEGVDALICGGIGGGAIAALTQAGIDVYAGASGSCDGAVDAFLAGQMTQVAGPTCDHHGHAGGCGGHDCTCH